MTVFIYALFVEGDEKNVRYIGQTIDLTRRYREHLVDVQNTHKVHWIQAALAVGDKIGIKVLETLNDPDDEQLKFVEHFWINLFQNQGCKLTNSSDWGYGCKGYKHTSEAIEKIRAASTGRNTGELNSQSKLSNEQVDIIRVRFLAGETQKDLAHEFGVSPSSLSRIMCGNRRGRQPTSVGRIRVNSLKAKQQEALDSI